MYKDCNMTQLTLPMETAILIPQLDISRYVNDLGKLIPDNEFKHHCGATSYYGSIINWTGQPIFEIEPILSKDDVKNNPLR